MHGCAAIVVEKRMAQWKTWRSPRFHQCWSSIWSVSARRNYPMPNSSIQFSFHWSDSMFDGFSPRIRATNRVNKIILILSLIVIYKNPPTIARNDNTDSTIYLLSATIVEVCPMDITQVRSVDCLPKQRWIMSVSVFVILAYCKNTVTGKWFCYDDHLVSEIEPSRVCTPDAYILFYCRRDTSSSSPSSESITKSPSSQQTDSLGQEFEDRLTLDDSSSQPSTNVDEKLIWSSPKDKPNHYTLQAPQPLPRRLLTPISLSSSQDEIVQPVAPCPAPRTRKLPQMELEMNALSSQLILPPSPAHRRPPPMAPAVNYIYPQPSLRTDHLIEPLNGFHTASSHRYPRLEQSNPWNRYNHQRYSDDEPEPNVVYHTTIVRPSRNDW